MSDRKRQILKTINPQLLDQVLFDLELTQAFFDDDLQDANRTYPDAIFRISNGLVGLFPKGPVLEPPQENVSIQEQLQISPS